MSRSRICVAKVGGSLLSSADLSRRLQMWLSLEMAAHPDTHYLLIVGGGKLVDAIREIDRASPIDAAVAHWICIDLMDVTARMLGALLPEISVIDHFQQIESCVMRPGATILCPGQFLRQIEPKFAGTRLATNWTVTSDAIAARLAAVLNADDLVLVKTIPPPLARAEALDDWIAGLAASGYVDEFLPAITPELANLRFAVLSEPEPWQTRDLI